MINFITRYFTSLWAFITSPFRALWRLIVRIFPPREFTVMDTPRGNVYTFRQSSFWRFTKFCGKLGLIIWATWSTYVFVYHRPLLQKRTQELAEAKSLHERQMSDLQVYLKKYNELARDLNVIDDKILNTKSLSTEKKEELMNTRLKTWAELDFLHTRLTEMFTNDEYSAEYTKLSELSTEFELTRAENEALKKKNAQLLESMQEIVTADTKIFDTVSNLAADNIDSLRENMKNISSTIASLGLTQTKLVQSANKFSNPLVGAAFSPIEFDKNLDPKYQKLADDLELWNGLAKLDKILPIGAPVEKMRITSNFGTRNDPFTGKPSKHRGIDFAGKIGTELMAVAPGRVVSAGERVGYGTTVEIDHGLGFTTLYAHLSQITVARGDWVRPGTVVGLAGSTGRSTGPHLHYEIRYKGVPFDPVKFVKE
ncbi:MAG TPA: peptidoglycan DD-metalloendopeptidase family protein [Candidatus Enterousia avicola]|uniref:Peptidoglycan DD-metalloendopeptidase family protein n=1 Tax=Candidatus Enterousia avicola TaxID=2840787 RepID=A0A9D1SN45_9PROT|nr:peptidoglycan DD-metalloendopeptidase family protein [Candidatus Enterousia avicola]